MKTVLVLRHGKSSWSEPWLSDRDRPLKKRGTKAATRMGREMLVCELEPDLILCSTARRAFDTAKRARKAMRTKPKIERKEKLYFKGPGAHLRVLQKLSDRYQRVLVVGHNPDLEVLVHRLGAEPIEMPTGTLACIDLDTVSWATLGDAVGKLRFALTPKALDE